MATPYSIPTGTSLEFNFREELYTAPEYNAVSFNFLFSGDLVVKLPSFTTSFYAINPDKIGLVQNDLPALVRGTQEATVIDTGDLTSNLPSITASGTDYTGTQASLPALTIQDPENDTSTYPELQSSLSSFTASGTTNPLLDSFHIDYIDDNEYTAVLPSFSLTSDVDVQDWFTCGAEIPVLTINPDDAVAHIHPSFLESTLPSLTASVIAGWNTNWQQNTDGFDLYTDSWSLDGYGIVGAVGKLEYYSDLYPAELPAITGGGTDDQAAEVGAALAAELPDHWTLDSDCDVGAVGRLDAKLPKLKTSGYMNIGRVASLAKSLPALTASLRSGTALDVNLPMFTTSLSGNVGATSTLSSRLPKIKLIATATCGVVCTLSRPLPELTLSAASSGTISMTLSKTLPSFLFSIQASEHTRFGDYVLKFSDW